MNKVLRRGLVMAVLAGPMAGCAANPLIGQWTATNSAGGGSLMATMALNADGNASLTLAGTGTCTGTLTFQGLTWSSDASSIIFAGMGTCAGMVTCMVSGTTVNIDCAHAPGGLQAGACTYALGADNHSLTVSDCSGTSGGSTTYTRAAN